MFDHVETKNEAAILAVNMVLPEGNMTDYVFVLYQQEGGEYDECWMTEGVRQYIADATSAFDDGPDVLTGYPHADHTSGLVHQGSTGETPGQGTVGLDISGDFSAVR